MSTASDVTQWEIRSRRQGTTVIIALRGELDLATAPDLEAHLSHLRRWCVTDFVIDCDGLRFIDLAGMRVLVRERALAAERGRGFRLVNVAPALEHALVAAAFNALLHSGPRCDPPAA